LIKKVHLGCKIIKSNRDGIRIQKWIQGKISFKDDDMPKFYQNGNTLSCNSITVDDNNKKSGTLIVEEIKRGWG